MAYGEGTVYQRKDGKWVASVEAGYTPSGGRRRITRARATEAEAKRALRSIRREVLAEQQSTAVNPRTTLKAWIDTWAIDYKRTARPRTYSNDLALLGKWVIPTVGHRRLTDLTVTDLRKVEATMRRDGKSSTSIRYVRLILHRALRAAIVEGHRIPDSVMLAPKPKAAASKRQAIPAADAATLLKAATEKDTWPSLPDATSGPTQRARRLATEQDASRWVAALLQGMRQGECLGLTWDRVDLDAGTLTVDRQLVEMTAAEDVTGTDGVTYEHLMDGYYWGPVKTAAGSRVLPLVPWMAAALTAWRDQCPVSPYGLVWPRPDGGPWSKKDDRLAWRALQAVAGAHKEDGGYYLVHEARHSTATLLMAAGVPATVIIAIMGHTSVTTTLGYQHADLDQARQALEAVAPRLGLTSTPTP